MKCRTIFIWAFAVTLFFGSFALAVIPSYDQPMVTIGGAGGGYSATSQVKVRDGSVIIDQAGVGTTIGRDGSTVTIPGNLEVHGVLTTSLQELDPVFSESPAASITSNMKTSWDEGYTAFGWGNHASASYLKAVLDPDGGTTNIDGGWCIGKGGSLISCDQAKPIMMETDPAWASSPSYGITSNEIASWQEAHGWGNHANAGYAHVASPNFTGQITTPYCEAGDGGIKSYGPVQFNSGGEFSGTSVTFNDGLIVDINGRLVVIGRGADGGIDNTFPSVQAAGITASSVDGLTANALLNICTANAGTIEEGRTGALLNVRSVVNNYAMVHDYGGLSVQGNFFTLSAGAAVTATGIDFGTTGTRLGAVNATTVDATTCTCGGGTFTGLAPLVSPAFMGEVSNGDGGYKGAGYKLADGVALNTLYSAYGMPSGDGGTTSVFLVPSQDGGVRFWPVTTNGQIIQAPADGGDLPAGSYTVAGFSVIEINGSGMSGTPPSFPSNLYLKLVKIGADGGVTDLPNGLVYGILTAQAMMPQSATFGSYRWAVDFTASGTERVALYAAKQYPFMNDGGDSATIPAAYINANRVK